MGWLVAGLALAVAGLAVLLVLAVRVARQVRALRAAVGAARVRVGELDAALERLGPRRPSE